MNLLKQAIGAVWESDEQPEPTPTPPVTLPTNASWVNPTPVMSVPVDDTMYKNLLAKTNFDATPAGVKIQRYFLALEGTGLDTTLRYRSAINQAMKLDNISSNDILACFDTMDAVLKEEQQKFDRQAQSVEDTDITQKKVQISDIEKQITELTAKKSTLATEISRSQAFHSEAISSFSQAMRRRQSEIDTQKRDVSALLTR